MERMHAAPQESPDAPAVRSRGLTKRYGDLVAVAGVDLEVRRGECFGLLGPNGAGKTTTVEILEGLNEADEGTVELFGLPWNRHAAELRERIGVQLQETHLPAKLTVEEVIRLFRSFYRQGPTPDEIIDAVQLGEKRRTWVSRLSGGQKQRLSVACALAGSPDLLFLDEPTTGLDPQSRRSLWELIESFRAAGGSVLLTTHYMDEAARLCERIGIMDRGRIIALGTPAELIASLGAEHVVEFTVARDGDVVVDGFPDDAVLQALPAVHRVRRVEQRTLLTVGEVHAVVPALLEVVHAHGLHLAGLGTHHATLEDVFVSLTGRHLRED